ncbi:MAG: 50S ribosomal protein L22 [Candidatus Woesearchaeota archaeon]
MQYKYSSDASKPETVKALGRSLSISFKQSVEICNWIRGKESEKAKKMLQEVIDHKRAVPYRRFTGDIGHKKEVGPGRYPRNACTEILEIIKQAEASCQQKGFDTKNLVLSHIQAKKAPKQWHYGRKRRRVMKRAHIEIVATSQPKEAKKDSK